jgi:ABC-type branched-subunit amino acid transport system substrate-binding protein
MASSRLSVRARRQWRLFNAEPPVVRITAAGAVLVLLIGVLAAAGHDTGSSGGQGVATRARPRPGAIAGTTVPGGVAGGDGSSGASSGVTVGGGTGAGGGDGAGGSVPPPGSGVAPDGTILTASDRGVTAEKIKVVFPYADLGPIGSATGLDPGSEDEPTAITAYVNDINSRGGINGRLIDPEIVKYNPLDDAEMRADCKDWTESQEIFAVVDSYGWHDDHQLCITQEHHTPLISKWTTVTDWTDRGNPYLWWTGPDDVEVLDNLVASSLDTLRNNRFAVLVSDRESDKLALAYLEDSLARAGVKEAIPPQQLSFNTATAQAQAPAVMTQLKLHDVKVVLPVLPFLQLVTFLNEEHSQHVRYELLLSDYESAIQAMLGLAESVYKNELQDTVGPTAFRLGSDEDPRGYTALGQTCSDQYHKQDPSKKDNLEGPGAAMTWCQNVYLFAQAATDAGDNLTRDTFNDAMSRIQGFGGSIVPDITFGAGVHAGPHLYRTVQIHVNDDKACPKKDDGGDQGSCWLILQDFQPAKAT